MSMRVADGPRGNDNLAIGLFNVDADRITDKVVIIDPSDPEKPGRADREAQARALLGSHQWVALKQFDVREDPDAPVRQGGVGAPFQSNLAEGEGLRITYHEPVLVIRDVAGREMLRRQMKSFSLPGGSRCEGCPRCPAPLAALEAAYGDRTRHVVVLVIQYHGGTDVCWEPDETFHVLRIPG
jgi:hypothetical protein